MSHEFELHHLVSELVSLMKVSDTADVDSQVELLAKNRTPYITTQVSLGTSFSSWTCCGYVIAGECPCC